VHGQSKGDPGGESHLLSVWSPGSASLLNLRDNSRLRFEHFFFLKKRSEKDFDVGA
jgi:hypothetical protein